MRLRYFITEVFLCNGLSQHQSQLHIEGDKNTYKRILMERYFSIQIGQNSTHPIGPIHTYHTFFRYKVQTTNSQNVPAFTIHPHLRIQTKKITTVDPIQIQRPITSQPLALQIPAIPATINRDKLKMEIMTVLPFYFITKIKPVPIHIA